MNGIRAKKKKKEKAIPAFSSAVSVEVSSGLFLLKGFLFSTFSTFSCYVKCMLTSQNHNRPSQGRSNIEIILNWAHLKANRNRTQPQIIQCCKNNNTLYSGAFLFFYILFCVSSLVVWFWALILYSSTWSMFRRTVVFTTRFWWGMLKKAFII